MRTETRYGGDRGTHDTCWVASSRTNNNKKKNPHVLDTIDKFSSLHHSGRYPIFKSHILFDVCL
jgi:hypothetical protein